MTAYVDCSECNDGVPWYYANVMGGLHHTAQMHPGCAIDRKDEEGCGAVWLACAIAQIEMEGGTIDDGRPTQEQ